MSIWLDFVACTLTPEIRIVAASSPASAATCRAISSSSSGRTFVNVTVLSVVSGGFAGSVHDP
jgi:hypothetical protein